MERTETYVRIGASIGCLVGLGCGVHDIMQTYDLTFTQALTNSIRSIPNVVREEYWIMTRDILAGVGAGGLAGGLIAKIKNFHTK